MSRSKTIREDVKFYTDILIAHYEDTDPELGEDSAICKLEIARHSVEVWWQLFSKSMGWSQNYLTGYAICLENPEVVSYVEAKLGREIFEDSHELEYIGSQFNPNSHLTINETLEKIDEAFEYLGDDRLPQGPSVLTNCAYRHFIFELLMSTSGSSSYWRMELQHALKALNYGEVRSLVSPESKKRQGRPYSLILAQKRAVAQVYFRIGKGLKKYVALDEVATGIGQSPETLRSWEKKLNRDRDYEFHLWSCKLAGEYFNEILNDGAAGIPNHDDFAFMRGISMPENARFLVERAKIHEEKLSDIMESLSDSRQKY